jgi:hypothetical protein
MLVLPQSVLVPGATGQRHLDAGAAAFRQVQEYQTVLVTNHCLPAPLLIAAGF